jgi:hypothetical protein
LFYDALESQSSSLSREGKKALANRASLLDIQTLWTIYHKANNLHIKQNVLNLVSLLSFWDRLPLLLEALTNPSEKLVLAAKNYLMIWCRERTRVFILPTPTQLGAINEIFKKVSNILDKETPLFIEEDLKMLHKP